MTDRPIIFSAPMVRALIEGRKTQTRRVLKQQPYEYRGKWWVTDRASGDCELQDWANGHVGVGLPYAPGDRLYVREAWTARMTHGWTIADARSRMFQEEILYRADGHESDDGWWPSIHMPREFSRLTLTVTEVRVQRLQDISEEDAMAEGAMRWGADFHGGGSTHQTARENFASLWNSLHGPEAWDANPWVVALAFTVQHGNIDKIGGAA